MPRVAVTDYTFGALDLEQAALQPLGCQVDAAQCRTEEQASALVQGADYVITQFAPLGARAVAAMDRARLIVRYGIGVDNVDLAAAAERAIPVYNVPDYCIDEVADHTLALILSLTRQTVRLTVGIRAGHWGAPLAIENFQALRDMTIGVVGCGRIGREVIRRLPPFKPRILAYDPLLSADDAWALGCERVPLERLWAESDLVTLHLPSTAETRGLVDGDTIARMKDGALLVNVARGTIVRPPALIEALRGQDIHDIYECRLVLEVCAIKRTAQRIDQEGIDHLNALITRMEAAMATGQVQLVATSDMAFHRLIISLSGNRALSNAWEPLAPLIETALGIAEATVEDLPEAVHGHNDIVTALARHDVRAAVELLRDHLPGGEKLVHEAIRSVRARYDNALQA